MGSDLGFREETRKEGDLWNGPLADSAFNGKLTPSRKSFPGTASGSSRHEAVQGSPLGNKKPPPR